MLSHRAPSSNRQARPGKLREVDIALAVKEIRACRPSSDRALAGQVLFSAPGGMSAKRLHVSGVRNTIGRPSAPAQPSMTPRARPKANAAVFASVGRAPTNSQKIAASSSTAMAPDFPGSIPRMVWAFIKRFQTLSGDAPRRTSALPRHAAGVRRTQTAPAGRRRSIGADWNVGLNASRTGQRPWKKEHLGHRQSRQKPFCQLCQCLGYPFFRARWHAGVRDSSSDCPWINEVIGAVAARRIFDSRGEPAGVLKHFQRASHCLPVGQT